jgi:ABC-2 type transport system ATP-binding protein
VTIIECQALSKIYTVAEKSAGLQGTLAHFWKRQYRQIPAVQNVSFQIQSGEVVGFLGPNGAGKTTTLKMLTGLIHPTSGHLQVANHVPYHRHPNFLKQITLVMGQKQQLIWDLPAWDSLRINGAVYGLLERECQQRVGELAEMLDLGDKLTQPVRKLSLGERMKAELMAALLHRPQILFLDEPTLGLDVNAQMSVRSFLKTYNSHYQATILLTSHYMADITALCSRVLVIHQGGLIYDGQLDALLDKFAPYRQVKLELNDPANVAQLSQFGDVEILSEREARVIVRREDLTETVSKILVQLDVCDLTITDPPIEEVIGRVFSSLDPP